MVSKTRAKQTSGAECRPSESDGRPSRATLQPLGGYVFVDMLSSGSWRLTHTLTREAFTFQAAECELCWDDGGSGEGMLIQVVGDAEEPNVTNLRDIFKKAVYVLDETKETFIEETLAEGGVTRYSFDETRVEHRRGIVEASVARSAAVFAFPVCAFRKPRAPNMMLFWTLSSFYKFLNLKAYDGTASRWVWNQVQSWQKQFVKNWGCDFVVQSTFVSTQTKRKVDLPFVDRCLPQPSVSTLGAIVLLTRWAYLAREVGGLSEEHAHEAAANLLQSFVDTMVDSMDGDMAVKIELVDGWRPRWPRPAACDTAFVQVVISPGGVVDISELCSRADMMGLRSVAGQWWAALEKHANANKMTIAYMFQALSGRKAHSLMMQVQYELAVKLELKFGSQGKQGESLGTKKSPMVFKWRNSEWEAEQQAEIDEALARYVLESKTHIGSAQFLSVAIDKGTPCKVSMYNSVLCIPSNLVERTADNSVSTGASAGGSSSVAGAEASIRGLARNLRHRMWLRRGRREAGAESWKPKPIYRVSARKWVDSLDNLIRVGTELPGLEAFCRGEGDKEWKEADWRQWRHIVVAMDLGSDGLTGSNWLLYAQGACMQRVDDPSHGANCDVRVMLKACGYWSYWLLQMVSFNVPFGPQQDNLRETEIKEQLEEAYDNEDCESCALFSGMSDELITEMRRNGVDFPNEVRPEQVCWNILRQGSGFRRIGQRLTMARFQDSVKGAVDNLKHWHRDKFERTYVCLEKGWLQGKKLERLVVREAAGDSVLEGGASTSSAIPRLDDTLLRSTAQNAVVISALLLSDDRNRRLSECILAASEEVRVWHGEQSKALKSTEEAQQWVLQQIGTESRKFLLHLELILKKPCDQATLERCGFATSLSACKKAPACETIVEDEFADCLGQCCFTMVGARARRGMWLFGYPMKLQRMLIDEASARRAVGEFETDCTNWQAYLDYDGRSTADKALRKRSWFNFTSVRQMMAAFGELGFAPNPEVEKVLRNKSLCIMSTQAVEETIGVQKNASQLKKCKRFRRPETAMHCVINDRLLCKRHRYRSILGMRTTGQKTARLPQDAFRPASQASSLPTGQVSGPSPTPSWHSPSAANLNVPVADCQVLKEAKEVGFAKVQDAWLGCIVDSTHRIAIKRIDQGGGGQDEAVGSPWLVGLYHWNESAVLVWPAVLKSDGSNLRYLELSEGLTDPMHVTIFDWEDWLGTDLVWRSWLWQTKHCRQEWVQKTAPALRLFIGGAKPLKEIAAYNSFWNLSKAQLVRIARHENIELGDETSLMQVLFDLVGGILTLEGDDIMRICRHRLASFDRATEFSGELLHLDAAVEVLDRSDHEQVYSEQKSQQHLLGEKVAFQKAFEHKMMDIDSERKPKRARKASAAPKKVVPTKLTQSVAKTLLPQGASIWVGWSRKEWWGHYPPFRRVSASWRVYGEHEACLTVLRRLWEEHCMVSGMTLSQVPIDGLFSESGAASSTSAA